MMRVSQYFLIMWWLAAGCSPTRYLHQQIDQAERDFKNHIGFTLYDPQQKKTLFDHQGDRYFIPASNTKIFTLFASIQLLGDSIPSLRYTERNDSLIFWGTGDPSFLYENVVSDSKTFAFLKGRTSRLFFSSGNFDAERFGPGWSWGDYKYAYQVERTPFPVYGNRVHVKKVNSVFEAMPAILNAEVMRSSNPKVNHEMVRGIDSNALSYFPGIKDTTSEWDIPFHYSDEMLARLLSDTLKKEVRIISGLSLSGSKVFYSVAADSLYKVMMQESDNFIAEQLLLVCAGVISDTLRSDIAIREVRKRFLTDLPDSVVWVDGSGLSRLNLFTPRTVVKMWEKIDGLMPRERLFGLLATGGVNGTIKSYYKAERPFVFGKTGTLRNNVMLSGFLVARSGRTLIFSWMNNNFTSPVGNVRGRMEEVLKNIYEKY